MLANIKSKSRSEKQKEKKKKQVHRTAIATDGLDTEDLFMCHITTASGGITFPPAATTEERVKQDGSVLVPSGKIRT